MNLEDFKIGQMVMVIGCGPGKCERCSEQCKSVGAMGRIYEITSETVRFRAKNGDGYSKYPNNVSLVSNYNRIDRMVSV